MQLTKILTKPLHKKMESLIVHFLVNEDCELLFCCFFGGEVELRIIFVGRTATDFCLASYTAEQNINNISALQTWTELLSFAAFPSFPEASGPKESN